MERDLLTRFTLRFRLKEIRDLRRLEGQWVEDDYFIKIFEL